MPVDAGLPRKPRSVWIGFDPREAAAFAVAKETARKVRRGCEIQVRGVVLAGLIGEGLYRRRTSVKDGRLFDEISEHPMATEFAISRFLVPHLATRFSGGPYGYALFMDCDVLVRTPLQDLFALADPSKAVMVVKHNHQPAEAAKMDGQVQSRYARKNWSSVMLFNLDHPANAALTVDLVNSVPGRDLHAFCWLEDEDIGGLDASWNWLVGHSSPEIEPDIVHFTDGIPTMPGYENCAYADEWRAALRQWAA
jgi:hypothetical protein